MWWDNGCCVDSLVVCKLMSSMALLMLSLVELMSSLLLATISSALLLAPCCSAVFSPCCSVVVSSPPLVMKSIKAANRVYPDFPLSSLLLIPLFQLLAFLSLAAVDVGCLLPVLVVRRPLQPLSSCQYYRYRTQPQRVAPLFPLLGMSCYRCRRWKLYSHNYP